MMEGWNVRIDPVDDWKGHLVKEGLKTVKWKRW